jgi:carboxylesterase
VQRGDAFELGDGEVGVVCVHGLTGTPYEVRFLGEALAAAGFAVRAPLLPGHGTSVDDLARTRWTDWVDAVERAFDAARARRARVAIVGQSLGGLLALELAGRRRDVVAVATLAAPLWLGRLGSAVARWAERGLLDRVRALPKLRGSDVRDRQVRADNPGYRAFPVRAIAELAIGMRAADAALARIVAPVLVLHGARDHTAPPACAPYVAERTRGVLRVLPRSYHLIAADVERDVVAAEVIGHLRRHAARTGDSACAT